MARRLRQAQDLQPSLMVGTAACDSVFPPDIDYTRLTPEQTLSRPPVQSVQYPRNLAIPLRNSSGNMTTPDDSRLLQFAL
jgi:hypothetical protein